jgi:hypothetical protein
MDNILFQAHSGWRFIVLILLVIAIITAFAGWFGNKDYTNGNRKLNLFTLIATHIQLLIGIALYFVSPFVQYQNIGAAMKNENTRFWTVEHGFIMIIAIVLITVGHSKSKKALTDLAKHKTIAVFFTLALLFIAAGVLMGGRPLFSISR